MQNVTDMGGRYICVKVLEVWNKIFEIVGIELVSSSVKFQTFVGLTRSHRSDPMYMSPITSSQSSEMR